MGRSVSKIVEKNKDGEKMMSEKTGRQAYASDLTDKQWEEIEPLYTGMRTYKWSKRELTNGDNYPMICHHIQLFTVFIDVLKKVAYGTKYWNIW